MIFKPVLILAVLLGGNMTHAADKDDARYASYACQQYALATMKTLGKPKVDASQSASPVAADDNRWAGQTGVWLATGAIHAQLRFGAPTVRSDYRCVVQKLSGGWKLLDLQWPQGQP